MEPKQLPGQTPLGIHRDPRGVALLYPDWWQEYDAPNGKLFSPGDLNTFISMEVTSLPTIVTAEDLPALEKGFLDALRKMPNSEIVEHRSIDNGILLGFEARQRFEGKMRWIRILYRGRAQVRLVAQGASEEQFEFWLKSFDPAMTSFVFDAAAMPTEQY